MVLYMKRSTQYVIALLRCQLPLCPDEVCSSVGSQK